MDYMEQLSWLLFLKSFDERSMERSRGIEAMTGAVLGRALRGEVLCFSPNGAV